MQRLLAWGDALVLGLAAVFVAGFLGCVVLQVLFRYVLAAPLPWSEEAARYLFVWTAFVAAAASVARNDQFSIPLFVEKLPHRARWALELLATTLGTLFVVIVIWKGAVMSWRLWPAASPVLEFPQGAVYTVIPLTGCYMLAHLVIRLTVLLRGGPEALDRR